jgi:NADH:ubiquinone oxidoreductase subunit F (NADH-binding)
MTDDSMTDSSTTLILDCPPSPDLETYVANGGGRALARALDAGAQDVLDELEAANLRGRGGAGFPTATKWRSVRAHADETDSDVHVVVNAAEGEPGTAKDRVLLRHDPYRILEGLLVAMAVTDAVAGWVGIKERFVEVEALVAARDELREAGWQGADQVRIVTGPDDYLLGEESALLEVIEGNGPLPRILKPYDRGVFGDEDGTQPNPTVVNNVETFAHVVRILEAGADAFRSHGTDGHPGTILVTVTGDVAEPCVVEVGTDTTLREVLTIAGAGEVKLIASGVSVPLLTPAHLDLPLDADVLRTADAGLGSAGFVVYDADRSAVGVARALAAFLAHGSCGQCNACSSGTAAALAVLDDLVAGTADANAVDVLIARAERADEAARCFLPTGAQWVLLSAVQRFPDDFRAAVEGGVTDTREYPVPVLDLDEDGVPVARPYVV